MVGVFIIGNGHRAAGACETSALPPLAGVPPMASPSGAALERFVNRLSSRSTFTDSEKSAVLGIKGQVRAFAAHVDFVGFGKVVDHSCLVMEGCVGHFGQSREGARQVSSCGSHVCY